MDNKIFLSLKLTSGLAPLLLLLAATINPATSLSCYACSSLTPGECESNSTQLMRVETCSSYPDYNNAINIGGLQFQVPQSMMNSHDQRPRCYKASLNTGYGSGYGSVIKARGCAPFDICMLSGQNNNNKLISCDTCESDRCNSATNLSSGGLACLLLGLLLVNFYSK